MMKARIDKVKAYLTRENLDAAFIFFPLDTGNFFPNVRYLTGFSGSMGAVFVTRKSSTFISDFRYIDQAKKQVKGSKVVILRKNPIAALADIKEAQQKNMRIAIEAHRLTLDQKNQLAKILPDAILVETTDVVENLAICKDQAEINNIKKAVAISDEAFKRILGYVKPGLTEKEVAAELEYQMKILGASREAFETIVASGYRSAMPHGVASNKKLKKGEFVTFDFGALYDGYCSDITRTIVLGKATSRQKKIYDIVLRANLAGIKKVKAGVSGKAVDDAARKIIVKAGYGSKFGHGTGHGIGLAVHAGPRITPLSDDILKSGMVLTIEPGIYISGWGGVRIEDDLVVRPKGSLVLNKSTKKLLEL